MPIKTHQDPEPTLNLTPMIDIVFLLIIFFMVGTKFAEMERQIKLEILAVKQFGAMKAATTKRVVQVYRDNTIVMDRQTYTVDELVHELSRARQEQPQLSVLVRGDGQGALQNVVTVLAACRDAGFERMGIAVRRDTERR